MVRSFNSIGVGGAGPFGSHFRPPTTTTSVLAIQSEEVWLEMATWRRWQDWALVVLGALMFIATFVFDAAMMPAAQYAGLIVGALMFLVGLYMLANPQSRPVEWAQIVLGVLLFISPWVLGFTSLVQLSWSAWVIGVLAVIAAAWVLFVEQPEVTSR